MALRGRLLATAANENVRFRGDPAVYLRIAKTVTNACNTLALVHLTLGEHPRVVFCARFV